MPATDGNAETARSVDKECFYHILTEGLNTAGKQVYLYAVNEKEGFAMERKTDRVSG